VTSRSSKRRGDLRPRRGSTARFDLDVELLLETVGDVERMIGRATPGMLSKVGVFPGARRAMS
jgi:hypothetical protein